MNTPISPDTPEVPEVVAEAPAVVAPPPPPPNDNRRRLRELLSVPERDRTDEQWDEIIELEIQMAPGNRVSGAEPNYGASPKPAQGRAGGGHAKKHRPRNNAGGNGGGGAGGGNNPGGGNNRRPRQNKPQGNPSA